ncbi:hypothetical protein SLS64_010645 [Diaporthe eres]|uniref:Uncharacterized protein n=1 Tax=Diaporthe eres TaxID=83184 RepID=A0ABR1NSL7_DIAER
MTNHFYGSSLFQAHLDPSDPTITEVVQTISVVQVIDGSGAIIETQTFASDPQTNLLDAETGSTIDTGFKAVSLTSDSAGAATTSSTATETPISSVDPVSTTSETTPPSANPTDTDYRFLVRKLYGIPVAFIAGHDPVVFILSRLDKWYNFFERAFKLHFQLE